MGDRVELGIELVDVLDVSREAVVVERSMVREGKGSAAEVGKGEVERLLESCLGVRSLAGLLETAAERVEVQDLSVIAGLDGSWHLTVLSDLARSTLSFGVGVRENEPGRCWGAKQSLSRWSSGSWVPWRSPTAAH